MRDLRDLGVLLLGFMPWLLFLLISGHTLASLERVFNQGMLATILGK